MSTWGRTYHRAVHRGDDHGYAAYLADQAIKRKAKRAPACPICGEKMQKANSDYWGEFWICRMYYVLDEATDRPSCMGYRR